jgi:hypothetical protein
VAFWLFTIRSTVASVNAASLEAYALTVSLNSQGLHLAFRNADHALGSFPEQTTMAISEERFKKLALKVQSLEEVAKPHPIMAWVPGTVLMALLGAGITVALHLNTRIDSTKTDISGLSTKIDKLDAAVKTLTSQQSDQTQKLIHDLLATAQTSNPSIAGKATLMAASLTTTLRKEKHEVPSEFFGASIDALNTINSKAGSEVLAAKLALADYRSAIYKPSNLAVIFAPGSKDGLSVKELENLPRDQDTTVKGFKVFRVGNPVVEPPPPGRINIAGNAPAILFNLNHGDLFYPYKGDNTSGKLPRISGLVIVTASQTLDSFVWENVVFVNARIRYMGGPVTLNNVRFLNCTFDTPEERRPVGVQQFLDYAALLSDASLSVGF